MGPCSVAPEALPELTNLASWIHDSAEMAEIAKNTFQCVDPQRRDKLRPFLEAQKLTEIKAYGYTIYRIKGKVEIRLTPNYRSIFFPLSVDSGTNGVSGELQIAGETLRQGQYLHFTKSFVL
ncbi:unnamed protein product, partial [Penicillium salamii]